MGNGALNWVALDFVIREPTMLIDVIAAVPIANWRRVNMMISLVLSSATQALAGTYVPALM
jgi:hypothetical protein